MATASPIAGTMWELSRRCTGRMFLLCPDRKFVDATLYCFAYSADKWSVLPHQLTIMHNHYHGEISDVLGTLVEFTIDFHSLSARCIKHALQRTRSSRPAPTRSRTPSLWASCAA